MALHFFGYHADGRSEKVGQCGIAIAGARRFFLDSLVMKPGWSALWRDSFAAAVEKAGPGHYRYGSKWTIETDYPAKVLAVPGIVPLLIGGEYLDVIDCCQWDSFDAYLLAVSSNVRRNVAQIEKLSDPVSVEHCYGLAVLPVIHHLSALRRTALARYGRRTNMVREYIGHVLKALLFRRYARAALVRYRGMVLAMFFGTGFGSTLHYNSGATRRDVNGFGPFLFVHVIRDWFARHPDGRIVLGLQESGFTHSSHSSHIRRKLRALRLDGGPLEFRVSDAVLKGPVSVSGDDSNGRAADRSWRPLGDSNPCYRRERAMS